MRGRPKLEKNINKNSKIDNPVISFRCPRELDLTFTAIRLEAGNIDRQTALVRIITYLTKPQSIETTKAIIQVEQK